MRPNTFPMLLALGVLAGCSGGTGRVVVEGAGPGEFLSLRAGPGLGFSAILGLPDGTSLERHECVTEVGQLWCKVSLPEAPRITGYVSSDYLSGL